MGGVSDVVVIDLTEERGFIGSFLKGAVKLIQYSDDPTDGDKLEFDDILQPEGLTKCLLTSYVIDEEWLLGKVKNVPKVIICTDNGQHDQKATLQREGRITWVFPAFPRFPAYGVMHCKLMLLTYPKYLRVVVSTGNLMPHDYDQVQNVSPSSCFTSNNNPLDCLYTGFT